MPEVIVIADDLSGAADTGVTFAERGYQSTVIWDSRTIPSADILVLTTESRHIPQDKAILRVRDAVAQLSGIKKFLFVYKKIDSTLRGHPAAELTAVMEGYGISRALVAPAFPAQKRTTVRGIHYVNGTALHQTNFGHEVPTANVRELFEDKRSTHAVLPLDLEIVHGGISAILEKYQSHTSHRMVAVADAETVEDLAVLVEASLIAGIRLYCGSAGLAQALAQTLAYRDSSRTRWALPHHGVGILGVIASRRDRTLQQIKYAKTLGIPVVSPDAAWYLTPATLHHSIAVILRKHLANSGVALLTAHELPDLPGKSTVICSRLAAEVKTLISKAKPAGLVLSGGDMAMAVSTALDARALMLCGEVEPGIPWGRFVDGIASGCPVVTKAGGFGDTSALAHALSFLDLKMDSPKCHFNTEFDV